jgi:hypothetical protein
MVARHDFVPLLVRPALRPGQRQGECEALSSAAAPGAREARFNI